MDSEESLRSALEQDGRLPDVTNNSLEVQRMFLFRFRAPNIGKLEAKRDVKGLIRALRYRKDPELRMEAAEALGSIGDPRAVEPLISALREGGEDFCEAVGRSLAKLIDSRN